MLVAIAMELLNDLCLLVCPWPLLYVLLQLLISPFSSPVSGVLVPITLLVLARPPRSLARCTGCGWVSARVVPALAVVSALVPLAALYALSWRASALLGHWPRCWIDDPEFIGAKDARFEGLRTCLYDVWLLSGWCFYTWIGLMIRLGRRMPRRALVRNLILMLLVWEAFIIEPGHRFLWWID